MDFKIYRIDVWYVGIEIGHLHHIEARGNTTDQSIPSKRPWKQYNRSIRNDEEGFITTNISSCQNTSIRHPSINKSHHSDVERFEKMTTKFNLIENTGMHAKMGIFEVYTILLALVYSDHDRIFSSFDEGPILRENHHDLCFLRMLIGLIFHLQHWGKACNRYYGVIDSAFDTCRMMMMRSSFILFIFLLHK